MPTVKKNNKKSWEYTRWRNTRAYRAKYAKHYAVVRSQSLDWDFRPSSWYRTEFGWVYFQTDFSRDLAKSIVRTGFFRSQWAAQHPIDRHHRACFVSVVRPPRDGHRVPAGFRASRHRVSGPSITRAAASLVSYCTRANEMISRATRKRSRRYGVMFAILLKNEWNFGFFSTRRVTQSDGHILCTVRCCRKRAIVKRTEIGPARYAYVFMYKDVIIFGWLLFVRSRRRRRLIQYIRPSLLSYPSPRRTSFSYSIDVRRSLSLSLSLAPHAHARSSCTSCTCIRRTCASVNHM